MDSRRERRQRSADMELGRRHAYWYGATRAQLVGALVLLCVLAAGVGWVVAPDTMAQVTRWTLGVLGALALAWGFWYVGIRRR
jgi:hypothetical protein